MNTTPLHYTTLHDFIRLHRSVNTVARFDPSGKHVFVGTTQGHLLVYNTRTKTVSGFIASTEPSTSLKAFLLSARWWRVTRYLELGRSEGSSLWRLGGTAFKTQPRRARLITRHRRIVTNSSDRVLRQFNLPVYPPPSPDNEYIEQELEPTHRFNDPISKVAWHAMSYSPDGEWLAGGWCSQDKIRNVC